MIDDRTTITLIGYALLGVAILTLILSTTWKRNLAALLVAWAYYQEKMRLERVKWYGEAKGEMERYRLMLGVVGVKVPEPVKSTNPHPNPHYQQEQTVGEWQKSMAAGQKVG